MAQGPLRLMFGRTSLRNRLKQQNELLSGDLERIAMRTRALRRSVVHAVVSPAGLGAALAAGFAFGRLRQKPRRKKLQKTDAEEAAAPRSWWWELLLPIAFSWARDFAVARFQRRAAKNSE